MFAAVRLTGFGIPVTLVEKAPSVSDDIRASTIHPPSLEMMEPYGISREILARGIKVPQWQIRIHTTGEKVVFDLNHIRAETDYPFRMQFEQAHLCAIMDRLLAAERLADIRYGTELISLGQDDHGVTIRVRDAGGWKC